MKSWTEIKINLRRALENHKDLDLKNWNFITCVLKYDSKLEVNDILKLFLIISSHFIVSEALGVENWILQQ